MRRQSILVLAIGVLLFGSVAITFASTASFQGLGDLDLFDSRAYGVSADGSVVVGRGNFTSGWGAFRWTESGGMESLSGDFQPSTAYGISADGLVIVGGGRNESGYTEAFRWTENGGFEGLGDIIGGSFESWAYDVSADGTVIAARGLDGFGHKACRWTAATGMQSLTETSSRSLAYGISANGRVIAGEHNGQGFRWTQSGGMEIIGGHCCEGVSADGSVVVGRGNFTSGWGAFRWTQSGGIQELGDLSGGSFNSYAYDVSDDGAVIVGRGTTDLGSEGFIWDSVNGMRNFKDVLENDYGLDLTGWQLASINSLSGDGLTFVGTGYNSSGYIEAWFATFFPIGGYIDWADLAAFADRWLDNGCSPANWCGGADINRSGNVDFADYAWLGYYWEDVAPEPNVASNPDPNDLATNVSITADLSWVAGTDTAAHRVYFGTTSPGDFQGYQSATTFDAGITDANTTYYWQIDEVGLGGTTTGAIWSFTTAPAPGQASNPNPIDTETDVSVTIDLSWIAGSDATSHDVYFGTNPTPDINEFQGNQAGTVFDPCTLDYKTTYYWQIDEVGLGGTTTGAVWSFTTMIDPNLVSRWRFDEVSGNIAYDSSGNENHGQLIDGIGNGLVWVPAESSLNFDGSNNLSRVLIPTSGMTTTAGTVAIWANLAEPQERGGGRDGQAYFFGCNNGGINKILLYMSNSDTQLDIKVGNHGENNITTLSTETWYHIALTWNAGIYAIYVDGSPLDTGTYGGLSSLPSMADIGNNGNSSTQSLHGLIDEVMIFDKSLSAAEIQQLCQDGAN